MDVKKIVNIAAQGTKAYKKVKDEHDKQKGFRSRNIRHQTRELVAQFPVLYSENLSFETVQWINEALETEYVSLIRLLMQNSKISDKFDGTAEFIRQFHQNIYKGQIVNENATIQEVIKSPEVVKLFTEANKDLLVEVSSDLNSKITLNVELNETILSESKPSSKFSTNIVRSEINKINQSTPTIISVKVTVMKDAAAIEKDILIGVKCVGHLIESEGVVKHVSDATVKKTMLMRLIKLTTGETKFFRDFLFDLRGRKAQAREVNDTKGGFWWKRLGELSKDARLQAAKQEKKWSFSPFRKKGNESGSFPVTTLVISINEVEAISNKVGFNLLDKPKMALKVINNFFLLSFAVVDESNETMYLFDEDTMQFRQLSFTAIRNFSKSSDSKDKSLYKI